jgi:hypothetical protein
MTYYVLNARHDGGKSYHCLEARTRQIAATRPSPTPQIKKGPEGPFFVRLGGSELDPILRLLEVCHDRLDYGHQSADVILAGLDHIAALLSVLVKRHQFSSGILID